MEVPLYVQTFRVPIIEYNYLFWVHAYLKAFKGWSHACTYADSVDKHVRIYATNSFGE